jgi:UDP-N-acetylmuramate dehydrogenase
MKPPPFVPNTNSSVKKESLHASPFNLVGLRGTLRHHEPMSKHTTWRVGGPAQWFYEPADLLDLIQFLQQIPKDIPITWIGLGSNLLVRDGGIPGIVIVTTGLLSEISLIDKTQLYIQAGVTCAKVARFAAKAGLGGSEFLAGIPGTFGGALAMNASAWGGETWTLVQSVETVDRYGQTHHRTLADYDIGYRHVKGPKGEWFIAATLQLIPTSAEESQEKIRTLLQQRNEKQPIGLPSCGSVFKNPPGEYAARLIERAGWKGYQLGGAMVSEKHANFIINHNNATASDIENLIQRIRESIKQKYHIDLELEVHVVGTANCSNQ